MKEKIFLAFDFGMKSIGVAIGQQLIGIARPLVSLKANNGVPEWNKIAVLFKEWEAKQVVLGFPINMDGSEQPITQHVRKFAKSLYERFHIPVDLHDERLSTVEARNQLFKKGGFQALKKGKIDSLSAVLILESWFETYTNNIV